jgi:hypothetical protein
LASARASASVRDSAWDSARDEFNRSVTEDIVWPAEGAWIETENL